MFELLRETDTDAARLPRAGVISEPKPDSKPGSKPEPDAKPEAGVAAEPESESPPDAAPKSPARATPDPKPAPKTAQSAVEARTGPGAKPEPEPEAEGPADQPQPTRVPSSMKPRVRVSSGPQAEPQAAAAEPPEGDGGYGTTTVEIAKAHLYIAGLAAVVIVILVWGIAYNLGADQKQRELEARYSLDPNVPPIIEPLDQELSYQDPTGGPGATPRTGSEPTNTGSQTVARPSASTNGLILVSSGTRDADPRQEGFNYLELIGTAYAVPQDEARRLVDYLAQNGLQAVALPVIDTQTGRVNNPLRYRVSLLSGAVERFGATRAERQALEARVAELGRTWSRQMGGSTNLAQPLWRKYSP